MYPHEELTRLAAHKLTLQRELGVCRAQCARAAARVVQPLHMLDRLMAIWRQLSPFAPLVAVPLGFAIKRTVFRRWKLAGTVMRWAPPIIGLFRGIKPFVTSAK
jgi:hypothetical protein